MQITKVSSMTGLTHTRDIDVTPEQLNRYYAGVDLIQNVFPNLSADDREFIMTGITPEEWGKAFEDEEEDECDCIY